MSVVDCGDVVAVVDESVLVTPVAVVVVVEAIVVLP